MTWGISTSSPIVKVYASQPQHVATAMQNPSFISCLHTKLISRDPLLSSYIWLAVEDCRFGVLTFSHRYQHDIKSFCVWSVNFHKLNGLLYTTDQRFAQKLLVQFNQWWFTSVSKDFPRSMFRQAQATTLQQTNINVAKPTIVKSFSLGNPWYVLLYVQPRVRRQISIPVTEKRPSSMTLALLYAKASVPQLRRKARSFAQNRGCERRKTTRRHKKMF